MFSYSLVDLYPIGGYGLGLYRFRVGIDVVFTFTRLFYRVYAGFQSAEVVFVLFREGGGVGL